MSMHRKGLIEIVNRDVPQGLLDDLVVTALAMIGTRKGLQVTVRSSLRILCMVTHINIANGKIRTVTVASDLISTAGYLTRMLRILTDDRHAYQDERQQEKIFVFLCVGMVDNGRWRDARNCKTW